MGNEGPRVTVVVLSYNRPDYLAEALRALTAQTYPHTRIVVVDNQSPASDRIAAVAAAFPNVEVIRNATNLGFTGGMNTGIRAATGDYVLLTEDDIVAERDCLDVLVSYLENHPEVALCTGLMFNHAGGSIRCAGGDSHLGTRYQKRIHGEDGTSEKDYPEPFSVSYVPGALMFARREHLQKLGGFREDFFMYFEDDELCARIRKDGKSIVVVPQCRVRHLEPLANYFPTELEFIKIRNFVSLYFLHAPAAVLPAFSLRYGLVALLRAAMGRERRFWYLLRAWAHVAVRLPRLIADRR
jgi:GT2 family glycosyltransferase